MKYLKAILIFIPAVIIFTGICLLRKVSGSDGKK